jgi:hypothetical protein
MIGRMAEYRAATRRTEAPEDRMPTAAEILDAPFPATPEREATEEQRELVNRSWAYNNDSLMIRPEGVRKVWDRGGVPWIKQFASSRWMAQGETMSDGAPLFLPDWTILLKTRGPVFADPDDARVAREEEARLEYQVKSDQRAASI